MQVIGCSAEELEAVTLALAGAAIERRAFVAWCDGDDVTAIVADAGDTAGDVQAAARRFVPELCA
jgi:hypothetical protein